MRKSPTLAWCALATSCTLTFVLIAGVPAKREGGALPGGRAEPGGVAQAETPRASPSPEPIAERDAPVEAKGAARTAEEEERRLARRSERQAAREQALAAAVDPVAAVEAVLASSPESFEGLVDSLAGLGAPAVPLLVAAVCGDSGLPEAPEDASGAASERQLAFREALRRMDGDARLECVASRAAVATEDERRVLVELLGELDHPGALDALYATVLSIEPVHLRHGSVAEAIETAFALRIASDSEGALALRRRLDDAQRELLVIVARACARVPTTASGLLIGSLIGRDRSLDLELFSTLARRASEHRLALPAPALDTLRRALTHPDPEFRRAAAAALGAVGDDVALAALVERIGDADERVAAAARWSLRRIARVDRGERQAPWAAWLAEQAQWREERRPEVVAWLRSESVDEVVKGIEGLVECPCFRGEAVAELEPLLGHEDDRVFLAAVAALESIGTSAALEALEGVPMRPETRRFAAASAVRRAFGLEIEVERRIREPAVRERDER
jgi:hypothetical protein